MVERIIEGISPVGAQSYTAAEEVVRPEEDRATSIFDVSTFLPPVTDIRIQEPLPGRTMSPNELKRTLRHILLDRTILRPDAAERSLAGAIEALSLGRGSGWIRPTIPADRLAELVSDDPDVFAQQVLGAYSVFEFTPKASRRRLFHDLNDLLGNRRNPLRTFVSAYHSSLLNWTGNSIRTNGEVPGGLMGIRMANAAGFTRPIYYISDTHSNVSGLWDILNMEVSFNETLLEAMHLDKAVLVLGGDGWFPFHSSSSYLNMGLAMMDALLLLTSELPGNFVWSGGNHDSTIRPPEILMGRETAVEMRASIMKRRGFSFLVDFQQAVDMLPNMVVIGDEGEIVAIGGHTPVADITPEQAVLSAFDPAIRRRLIFGTPYPGDLAATMEQMRYSMRAPGAAFLTGHVHPKDDVRSAFRPHPKSRGMIILRAYGKNIKGVRISRASPARVTIENFVGEERSRLSGVDLRAEALRMMRQPVTTVHQMPVPPLGLAAPALSGMFFMGRPILR